MEQKIIWAPQEGPQKALIDCPLSSILYGGARGGGKTDGILGKFALKSEKYKSLNAVFFRKEMPQQDDLIERAKEIYLPLGATWLDQKKTFIMRLGGRIRFRPLESITDAEKYQGQNLTDAAVEEAGNYPDPGPLDRLFGALRSTAGVPIQLILSANPGGPGHLWIKDRFIDPAPLGMKILERKLPNGKIHKFTYIPSRVWDNKILLKNDPEYIDRLYLTGSEALVAAWIYGDWSQISGSFYPEFGAKHVVRPFAIPSGWNRVGAFDWGSSRPYCFLWAAISNGQNDDFTPSHIPAGAIVVYREDYGASGPNKGLHLHAEDVGDRIRSKFARDEKLIYIVADPACWKEDGGPSIAERLRGRGLDNLRPADNSRITGWDMFRARLQGEDGHPMIYFFSTCVNCIRTIPVLQHDEKQPEDVDTDSEDHAGDTIRYLCMSRIWTKAAPQPPQPHVITYRDMLKDHQRDLRSRARH